jgi:hypothetical protein
MSGVCGIATGEGFARLDDGSLTAGFFLLSKGGLVVKSSSNEERYQKITLTLAD